MSSKLFEEAIADARKLKEVAESNAKKAILEAVTPKIRDFIEEQLLEGEDADNQKDEQDKEILDEEDVVLNEKSMSMLLNLIGNGSNASENEGVAKNEIFNSVRSAFTELDDSQKNKLLSIANKINENADNLTNRQINNNVGNNEENSTMSDNKFYEVDLKMLREAIEGHHESDVEEMMYEEEQEEGMHSDDMSEKEMEELMNEIKLVLDLGDEIDEDALPEDLLGMVLAEEEEEGDAELEDEEAGEEEMDMDDMDLGTEEPEEEEPAEELEEMFEVDPADLKEELTRLRRAIREGKMDHHFGGKGPKKLGAKSSFGGGARGSDAFTNPPQINKLNETIKKLRRTNRAQTEKLTKYRSAVKTLREQLEDLNLFNAKLLYVNKLLQNKSLNESEKRSIIKALDEAKSLTEAKSLYRSLTETFTRGNRKTLKESRHLGSSSRTTTSSSSSRRSNSGELGRWQTLAGIK